MENYNQNNFTSYTVLDSSPASNTGAISKKFMANVFSWMFLALAVSAFFAYLFSENETLKAILYQPTEYGGYSMTGAGLFVAFSPLAFVLIMSFGYRKLSSVALTALFVLFSAMMGMSLSSILFVYTASSVIGCFASASVMFGIMAVMGYTTDKDLTSFGSMLTMGLIGIIIASMVNMFLHSEALYYIISFIGIAVFTGLTAYDVQKLKRIGAGIEYQGDGVTVNDTTKLALLGALNLYLDFINLFLMLLRVFGRQK